MKFAITGERIRVSNNDSTIGIYKLEGDKLVGPRGRTIEFSTPEKLQRIKDAVSQYKSPEREKKYGFEIADSERGPAWKFSHVENDAHGVYVREIDPGSGTIEIEL